MLHYKINVKEFPIRKTTPEYDMSKDAADLLTVHTNTTQSKITPKPYPSKKFQGLNYYEPRKKYGLKKVNMMDPYDKFEDLNLKTPENNEAQIQNHWLGNDKVAAKDEDNTLYYEKNLKGKDATNLLITNMRKEAEIANPGSTKWNPPDLAKLSREQLADEIKRISQEKNDKEQNEFMEALNKSLEEETNPTTRVGTTTNNNNKPVIDIKSVTPKEKRIIEKIMDNEVESKEEDAADLITKKLRELNDIKREKKKARETMEKVKKERVIATNKKHENMTEAEILESERQRAKRDRKNYKPRILTDNQLENRRAKHEHKKAIFKEIAGEAVESAEALQASKKLKAAQVIKRSVNRAAESHRLKKEVAQEVLQAKANREIELKQSEDTEERKIKVREEIDRLDAKVELNRLQNEYKALTGLGLQGKRNWGTEKYEEKIEQYKKTQREKKK